MAYSFDRSLKILVGVLIAAFVADLAVASLVGVGAVDPERFTAPGDSRPLVVASTTVLADMVGEVGGGLVQTVSIVGPGGDPHVYEPTPRDQVIIERADLVVLNGFGLEPKIEKMVESVSRPGLRVVEAAEGLDPHYEDNARTVPDPHMWGSIPHARAYVANVRDALVAADPTNARTYRANADAYLVELALVDAHVRAVIDTIPPENRKLVTTHDAFRYFGNEYGVQVVDTVWGVTTDTEPSPEDVRRLVERLRELNVPAVFVEDSVNPKLLEAAAREAGVKNAGTLYSDSLGFPGSGAHTYSTMLLRNANTLAGGLGGTPSEVVT